MKTFTKHILLLALMLFGVAGAAWALPRAPQKFTGPVDIYSLMDGDTLAPGFSLTYGHDQYDNIYFANGRYSANGTPQAGPYNGNLTDPELQGTSFTAGNIIFNYAQDGIDTLAPMVDMYTPGNAWVVSNFYQSVEGVELTLSGIEIVIDYPVQDAAGNWTFTMPGYNAALNVTYYLQPDLAWTYNSAAMPAEGLTAYRGFELPVIGGIGASMDEDFLTALEGGTVSLRYGSVNGIVTFTNPNDRQTATVTGSGLDTVYMVFDGNDDYQYDSAFFAVNILDPDTLTLAKEGNGTVSALVGGGEETLLTTVTATGETSYSQSPDGIVTVTLNNTSNYSITYGWIENGTVTVEAPQGYTITRCVFRQNDKTPLEDDQAPFTATMADYTVSAVTSTGQVYGVDVLSGENMDGISSIEVYGYASGSDSVVVLDETAGTYAVIPGAEVQVVATAQDGNYVSAWSDNRQPQHYTSDTNTITVGESMTLTATFAQNPLLTLATDGYGTVTLDGDSIGTVYTFTFEHPGNSEDDRAITIPANRLPYDTTFSYNANIEFADAYDQAGESVSIIAHGAHTVTVRISGPFEYGGYYSCELEGGDRDDWTISCTTGTGPVTPNGITKTGDNTYRVLPGTQLSVTATPGEGSYLAQWSDQTEPVEGNARLGSSHPYTMPATPATLTATFNEIPVLTLASNNSEWGTVELDGVTPGPTTYDITISENPYPDVTYTNVSFPFHTTVFLHEGLDWVDVVGQSSLIAEKNGNSADITINGPYGGGTIEYGYGAGEGGHKAIFCTAVEGLPIMPEGVVAYAGYGDYLVLPGTQVKVIATPDSAHYFVNWNEETARNSNTAVEKTLTMGTANAELTANFALKPTLTLAHNDGGEMEVMPALDTVATHLSESMMDGWDGNYDVLTAEDLPGFIPVSEAAAIAMTGYSTAQMYILIYDFATDGQVKYITYEGSTGSPSSWALQKTNIYGARNIQPVYFTTVTPSNVIASTEPNTYYIDYNTSVTVKATPSDTTYLVRFDQDADINSNVAVEKTYGPLTAALTTAEANFQAKPVLTLAHNDGGTLEAIIGGGPVWGDGENNFAPTLPYTADGITLSTEGEAIIYGSGYSWSGTWRSKSSSDKFVFTNESGNFSRIEMTLSGNFPKEWGEGWTVNGDQAVWEGNANRVEIVNCTTYVTQITFSGSGAVTSNVIASSTPNTYYVDYNTDVTVVATPDSAHYLVNFVGGADTNSNVAVNNTFTVTADTTLTANFQAKPTLTLTANDGGVLTLDGYSPAATTYNITIEGGNTYTNVTFPFQTTVFLHDGLYDVGSGQYPLSAVRDGNSAAITISEPYGGDRSVSYTYIDNEDFISGHKNISCQSVESAPIIPAGVVSANATLDTFTVDYGTDVTVKATPEVHHHLEGWSCTPGTVIPGPDSTATLTLTQDETVSATFAQNAPELAWMYDQEAMPAEGVSAYDGFMVDTIMKISMSCSDEFIAAVQQDNATVHYGSVNGVVTFANPLRLMSVQINGIGPDTIYAVHDGSVMAYDSVWFPVNIMAPDTLTLVHNEGGEMTVETLTDSIRAIVADTTYAVVPGANVSVVAMPDSVHYLKNFVGGADTNSNIAVNNTFVVTADTTLTATFTAKPVLTLAANDTNWGSVTIPIGLVATDPTPAPTPTAVANPVITCVLMPDGSMQVTMSCTTQDADIYYTTDNVTSPTCDCPAAPEYTQPITFTEPVTIKAAAYTGNDWSAVVTKTITLGLPDGVAKLTDSTYRVDYGATVTVKAEATTLHHIAGWISEDSVAYPADSITYGNYFITEPDSLFPALSMLTFTVTADTTAEALFGLNSYDVFATAQLDDRDEIGSGLAMGRIAVIYTNVEGSVQGAGPADTLTYTAQGGSTSMLVVNSNYGYDFSGWYDVAADTLLSDAAMLSLTAAATVEARFVPDTFEVSAVVAVPGDTLAAAGTVTGAARYAYREMVTLEETPATGYHFVNWTAADSSVLGTDDSLTLQLVKDTVLTANFDTNVYNVVADVNIEGLGTVTGAGEVKHFLSTTLVATANLKYHFVMWVNAAGDSVSAADTLEVFPVGDTALTAVFDTNIYATVWSGETDTTYTSLPYEGLTATYTDFWGNEHTPVLTFVCGDQTVVTPNYPVTAGTWTVTATGAEGDSLTAPETTLTIKRAIVNVTGAVVETAKFADGTTTAVVTNAGTLNNVQGSDRVQHTTTAAYNTATVGDNKTITVTYALNGAAALLANYTLTPTTEVYTTEGYIIEPMVPNTDRPEDDTTVVEQGFDVYAYGYCTGSGYSIRYHLNTGAPDQYKLDFADSRFTDVDWTNLATPGADGTIDIVVPVDMPMGDYSVTVTFRDSRFTWLESAPMTMNFHINLPETFTMPLFNNVIALVDTCQCFSDIQWYHRANSSEEWKAIPGANGYYYHATDAELEGEFFVKAKYNGVETFTCPQTDMETLYTDDEQTVSVTAYPNPTTDGVTITVDGGTEWVHTLRVLSTVGVEKESRTFEGFTTTVDMRGYAKGAYMVIVDGVVVRVVRN